MIEAYPLCWPGEYPRSTNIRRSRFKNTLAGARDAVGAEIKRLGGKDPIISTNIPLKQNGDMYADWQRYKIKDHGCAVYFQLNGKQVCLCCDTYVSIWENLHAISRTIEALRQIDRDGVSDFLNRAFTGFTAIAAGKSCWEILGIAKTNNEEVVTARYRELSKQLHPDKPGGSELAFTELAAAKEDALKIIRGNH